MPRQPNNSFFRQRFAVLSLAVALTLASGRAQALCGDLGADGYLRASDALAVLRLAIAGDYEPRADIAIGASPADGAVTATDALAVLVAAVTTSIPHCAAEQKTAVVTLAACDFISGGLAELDLTTRSISKSRIGQTAADAVVREAGGRLFLLSRFGSDSVAELDPLTLDKLWECGVGSGANPHDIVLVSPTLGYVTRYDWSELAIIDPSKGSDCNGFLTGSIDLTTLADDDGFPEMDQMALVGSRLFVSVQRLDRNDFFLPSGAGALAVIDTGSNTLETSVELQLSNPFAETKGLLRDRNSGLLYVGGAGTLFTDLSDGGIEIIDPQRLRSAGLIASGAELGGDLIDFALAGSGRILAAVADKDFTVSVIDFDLSQAAPARTLISSRFLISDIELTENGELWISDRDCSRPGLRSFSIADGSEQGGDPIYPGLTPFNLLLRP